MKKKNFINVLSLFDGMSCGRVALNRAGIPVDTYYASEIDKYAMQISKKNHPEIIQLGCITKHEEWSVDLSSIDLIFAGFPCQAWSVAGKGKGKEDKRGALAWVMMDIFNRVKKKNPGVRFLFENVRMKKDFLKEVNELIGCEPVLINSALVSAQNRNRYYWQNINQIEQPEDLNILLSDILESDGPGYIKNHGKWKEKILKSQCLDANYFKGVDNHGQRTMVAVNYSSSGRPGGKIQDRATLNPNKAHSLTKAGYSPRSMTGVLLRPCEMRDYNPKNKLHHVANATDVTGNEQRRRVYNETGKGSCLDTAGGGNKEPKVLVEECVYRKLTPIECERLQTLPDNYTEGVSNTQRYKMIGNGWTIDVIAHILKGFKK